ncbi:type II toxin-antitoxin system VapC family toxin [Stenoxybacter acetivorans]|uniref:type II toxin-antitoxin system VapC family toxin n=1 Tax=Stenoxybacter acetivorans TaxID=422441 RepID=UPI00055B61C9|nr:type II toxin-antitoxin system VapC family toxin [Stenoxybacter acetivorans]
MYLLDTNVISEIRKINTGRADAGVETWAKQYSKALMYISAITLFELERGTLNLEKQDAQQGAVYRRWLENVVKLQFNGKILAIEAETALLCVAMHVPDKKGLADSLIAATAIQHGLIVVTRNTKDFAHTGAQLLNPFKEQ